jgi:hypothetical protein
MKKIAYFRKLLGVGTCLLLCSYISAQVNCYQWDYTDEAGVVVTLTNASGDEVKKLYDNIDNTTCTLSVGDIIEVEFPYAMCFTGMLIYSGDETPVPAANFQIHGQKDGGSWENNKGKAAATNGDRGNGKFYTVANLTTAAGAIGYKKIRLECVNQPVTISEFQLFGFPNIASGNTAYPADLIRNDNAGLTSSTIAETSTQKFIYINDGGRTTRCNFSDKTIWIEIAFSEAKTVKSYLICGANNTDRNRHLKNWTLKGSNTEGEEKEWETIDEVTDFLFPYANYADMKFPVAEPGSYKYYRLEGTSPGPDTQTAISELQFYDTEIYALYSSADVAVINNIIENNSLAWTKAAPADGYSSVPDNWTGVIWDSKSPKLIKKLNVENNSLTGTLDVSDLTALQELRCGDNQLAALDISDLTALQTLDCNSNQLTALDLSAATSVETFNGTGQTPPVITMNKNGEVYEASIIMGDGATFENENLSYTSGTLTSTATTATSSGFTSPTGGPAGETLSGTLTLAYNDGTGMDKALEQSQPQPTGYSDMLGRKLDAAPQKGLYIILYDDGTVRKAVK